MTKILYEFERIQDCMSSMESKLADIDSITTNVSSFTCEVDEISADLETAKGKTKQLSESLRTKMSDRIKKTNSLCSDYLNFEGKMSSHSIFGLDLAAKITSTPSTNNLSSLETTGNSENTDAPAFTNYDIKAGDTLSKIAKKYNVSVDSLINANKEIIDNPNLIYVGDTLQIPIVIANEINFLNYSVKSGDTLNKIAKSYNVSVDTIINANKDKIKSANLIYVGDTLQIPNTSNTTTIENQNTNDNKNTLLNNTIDTNNNQVNNNISAKNIIDVPKNLGNVHTYMGWQMITSPTSNQYKLRNDVGMNFDSEGFGIVDDRYVVACTTTYGNVGDYVDFVQKDGTVIKTIIGDIKNQSDPGCTSWGHNNGECIIEFVVDKNSWYTNNKGSHVNPGNTNCHPEWNQDIIQAINYGSYYDYQQNNQNL